MDDEKKWIEAVFALKDKYLVNRDEEQSTAKNVRLFRKKMTALFREKPAGLFWDKVINGHFEDWLDTAKDDEIYDK